MLGSSFSITLAIPLQLALCLFICLVVDNSILSFNFARAYPSQSKNIRFRDGRLEDEFTIAVIMAKELMNPFGISHKNNLLIAEDIATGERIGWSQIRSIGYSSVPLDPSQFEDDESGDKSSLTLRDTQSSLSIEQDVDEYMWEEFEKDPVNFPNGFASLPWSKEYCQASEAANKRSKRRERLVEAELARRPKLWELSSVYVAPTFRNQGIGTELVKGVLAKQQQQNKGKEVYALTLVKMIPWYQSLGFALLDKEDVPSSMALEVAAGGIITSFIGEELVCIRTSLQ
jgi:GNAT superfamily N-acetyltransferase